MHYGLRDNIEASNFYQNRALDFILKMREINGEVMDRTDNYMRFRDRMGFEEKDLPEADLKCLEGCKSAYFHFDEESLKLIYEK